MTKERDKVRKVSKTASETHDQTLHRQEQKRTHLACAEGSALQCCSFVCFLLLFFVCLFVCLFVLFVCLSVCLLACLLFGVIEHLAMGHQGNGQVFSEQKSKHLFVINYVVTNS